MTVVLSALTPLKSQSSGRNLFFQNNGGNHRHNKEEGLCQTNDDEKDEATWLHLPAFVRAFKRLSCIKCDIQNELNFSLIYARQRNCIKYNVTNIESYSSCNIQPRK